MDIEKVDGLSMDMEEEARKRLQSVFPECFAEGKLDIDKLLTLCGEYVTNDYEKYQFEWKGKGESLILAQKRSAGALRPCPEESVDFENTKNVYIEGDNLEVLKLLQTAYYRKVKMIYIDPPYNTGNDFVYEDDFAEPLLSYKEVINQTTKSNPETMGRFHTNWLNMMYPRLKLAATLLRDDGVIFISVDDNEVHNLRKLCDEVFGEENFVAEFVWERAFAPKNDAKYVSNSHDYILMYAKNMTEFKIGKLERSEEANSRYKNLDDDPRGPWASDNLTVKTYSESYDYEIVTPSGKVVKPTNGRCWVTSKERMQELIADNRIWFGDAGDNMPRLKRFLSDVQNGMVPISIMYFKDVGHNQEGRQEVKELFSDIGLFDGPKPVRLMKRLMAIANTNKEDIILDFFSGSATTAHAVMQLNKEDNGNRRFIMVQLPEICDEKSEAFKAGYKNICEIGKERIRRAGAKLLAEKEEEEKQLTLEAGESKPLSAVLPEAKPATPPDIFPVLDIGFRVFKLDTSNLKKWDGTPLGDNQPQSLFDRIGNMIVSIKNDRSEMDVVWEVVLKMGVPLDYPVIPIEIGGKTAYSIGEDCMLLVCLEGGLTVEDIEAMAEYAPANIILAENGIEDDTVMSNAFYILRDRNIKLKLV